MSDAITPGRKRSSRAHVEHIHIAINASGSMRRLEQIEAVAGVGLVGDRYAAGTGFWRDAKVSRDLTLVEAEALSRLAAEFGIDLAPGDTRRNLTTRGVRLNNLVDRTLWIGDVLARGTSLCEPCQHLADVTGKPLLRPLVHRGGLRADLLNSGQIHVGDRIEAVQEQAGIGVLVVREGRVLLGRRLAHHGYGTWSVPGGKPKQGESPERCALRELHEETGLVGTNPRVIAQTIDGFVETHAVFRTQFVRVEASDDDPAVREPEKTEEWGWHPWKLLPTPLFGPVASLRASGFEPTGSPGRDPLK
jgi:ADP-ribose pyrophosphatase YjhB (NUDIX family)